MPDLLVIAEVVKLLILNITLQSHFRAMSILALTAAQHSRKLGKITHKSRGLRQQNWHDNCNSVELEPGVAKAKRCRLSRDADIYEGFFIETDIALESIAKIELTSDGNTVVSCSGRAAAALAMLNSKVDAGRGLIWLPFPKLYAIAVSCTFEIIVTLQTLGRTLESRKWQCRTLLSQQIDTDSIKIIEDYITAVEEGSICLYATFSYINPESAPKEFRHWIIRPLEHIASIAAGAGQHKEILHFSGVVHRLVFYFCQPGDTQPLDILRSVELSLHGTLHTQLSGRAALAADKFAAGAHIPDRAIYTVTFEPRRDMLGAQEHSLLVLDKISDQALTVNIEPQSSSVELIIVIETGNLVIYKDASFTLKYSD